jgi:hypothetical protein
VPIWTLVNPPIYKPDAVPTQSGWEDPVTGELLVAIRQLEEKRVDRIDDILINLSLESGFNLLTEQEDVYDRPFFIVLE